MENQENRFETSPRILLKDQVMKLLDIKSINTLKKYINEDGLKCHQIRDKMWFLEDEVISFVKAK